MAELKKKSKAASPVAKAKIAKTVSSKTSEEVLDINKALGRVTVIHGAQELNYDLAGKTIAYVREALSSVLQIPKNAEAWIDNQSITDENIKLTQNATLEFIKSSGVKGKI